jgi:glycosyltransferase involved in cell wall biosynthesis
MIPMRRVPVVDPAQVPTEGSPAKRPKSAAFDMRQLGDRCRDNKMWSEAARFYGEHVLSHPDDFAIWVQRGNCLKEAGFCAEALDSYNSAIAINSTDADVFLQRGHVEKLLGQRDEAIRSYGMSLVLRPHDNDALRELLGLGAQNVAAELLRNAGRPEATTTVLQTEEENSGSEEAIARRRLRVLYISDSLGTPIQARGIFSYSIALVEMLAGLGAQITLLVEMADGYGPERPGKKENDRNIIPRKPRKYRLSPVALNSWLLSEAYRYFNSEGFSFDMAFGNKSVQWLYQRVPELVRFLFRGYACLIRRRSYLITSSDNFVEFIPPAGGHLQKVHRLLYVERFYSDSMSRAVKGLVSVRVSAAGYDAVIIDTPHYVGVDDIARSRIFTIIHDLIPLRDPFMWSEWRAIFLAKLSISLKRRENLIFVSEYTRSLFYSQFPAHKPKRDIVVYPTIRKEQMMLASAVEAPGKSSFLQKICDDREYIDRRRIAARASRMSDDPRARAALTKQFEETFGRWDGSLPYFATAVSDEPRKNIKIFCQIAPDFIRKCNFIVMGQVDGNRYMHEESELYPNLHFTGYIGEHEKTEILRHATGVIFPSLAEGFGIPVVEGALFGKPIICSDIPVFREIANDLATYFDPYRPDELSFRVAQVLEDPGACAEAGEALRRVVSKRFSQQEMQKRLARILNEAGVLVVGGRRRWQKAMLLRSNVSSS